MKTFLNKSVCVLAAVAALAVGIATGHAQQFAVNPVTIGITNLNGGNSTNNAIAAASAVTYTSGTSNALISLQKYDGTSISVSSALMGAGTSAVTAMFDASNDGTNWVAPFTFVTYSANGTTRAGSGTNLVNQHWQFYRLKYVTNASNEVLTNLMVTFTRKPKRNG